LYHWPDRKLWPTDYDRAERLYRLALAADLDTEGRAIVMDRLDDLRRTRNKKDFINTISHDLRNPLSVIKGYSDILANAATENGFDKSMVLGIRAIQRSAQRMVAMIDDLVDSARLEVGN